MSTVELEPLPEDWSRAMAVVAHPDDLEYAQRVPSPAGRVKAAR